MYGGSLSFLEAPPPCFPLWLHSEHASAGHKGSFSHALTGSFLAPSLSVAMVPVVLDGELACKQPGADTPAFCTPAGPSSWMPAKETGTGAVFAFVSCGVSAHSKLTKTLTPALPLHHHQWGCNRNNKEHLKKAIFPGRNVLHLTS